MNELTICKRIAELEGFDFTLSNNKVNAKPFTVTDTFDCCHMGFIFNPLTDDGLCFRLMDKYNVLREGTGTVFYRCVIANYGNGPEYYRATAETLNKAVCLTIIEANKNEN